MGHNHLCHDCGAVLYYVASDADETSTTDHRIGGRCPDCQGNAGEFWALEHAPSWGIYICRARYVSDTAGYVESARPYIMTTVGAGQIELSNITWRDLPHRPCDGCFGGSANSVWIITESERAEIIAINERRQADIEAAKCAAEQQREAEREVSAADRARIRAGISADTVSRRDITDEGGTTAMYTHTIRCLDGEVLCLIERSIYDVGIVINPAYPLAPGMAPGGLATTRVGDVNVWQDYAGAGKGWVDIRPMTDNEIAALAYIHAFGGHARSYIRM